MKHSKNIKIKYNVICDLGFLSKDNKVNIIGIFDKIFASEFPAVHPRCSLICSVKFTDFQGNHKVDLHIYDEKNQVRLPQTYTNKLQVISVEQDINIIVNFVNMQLPKPSNYSIRILIDDVLVSSAPFEVIKQSETNGSN